MKLQNNRPRWTGIEGNQQKIKLFRALLMNMSFPISIIVHFWLQHGMNMFEVLLLQALFAIALAALEVPSGYYADLLGRKRALLLGAFLDWLGVVIYSISSSFSGFLAAELCMAAGMSLISGADEALLYDSLLQLKAEKRFSKIWGRVRFYEMVFAATGCLIGGALALIDLRLPFYVAVVFSSLCVAVAASLKEPERRKLDKSRGNCQEILAIARQCLLENGHLRWMISLSAVFVSVLSIVFWLYQPYLKLSGVEQRYFGVLYAAMNVIAALAAWQTHRLLAWLGRIGTLMLVLAVTAASLVCLGNFVFAGSFIFIFLHQMARGAGGITISECINDLADSEIRATVLSVNSLSMRILYSIALLVMGWLVERWGILVGINVLAFSLVAVALLLFRNVPRDLFSKNKDQEGGNVSVNETENIKVEFAS